jgi:hypothetical protein
MAGRDPFIELAGFERLHALERRVYYSPVAIFLTLIALGAAVYWFWSLGLGVERFFAEPFFIGYGVFLASYAGLICYYYLYRFRRLPCPSCGQIMQPYVADMGEGGWRRMIFAIEIGGRYYRQPYDEDDRRPWIRLMKHVRACRDCRKFFDCSRLVMETCTEDELALLEQRVRA